MQGCCYMLTLRDHSDSAQYHGCPQRSSPHDTARHRTVPHNLAYTCGPCISTEHTQVCANVQIHVICAEQCGSAWTTADSCGKSTQLSTLFKTCLISVDCSLRNCMVPHRVWTQQYFFICSISPDTCGTQYHALSEWAPYSFTPCCFTVA